jgi:putative chitinase
MFPRPASGEKRAIYDAYMIAILSPEAADLLAKFQITTPLRAAHLFATWAHETGGFTVLWESGNYSAERILTVFGKGAHSACVTPAEAKRLAGNAFATFERVYGLGNPGKAKELGNTAAGDGFNFRGLGIQQITGKGDHCKYANLIGCTPAELASPINAIHAALLEWKDKKCNALADKDDVLGVRKRINGGTKGLDDVRAKLATIKRAGGIGVMPLLDSNVLAQLGDIDDPDGEPIVQTIQLKLSAAAFPVGAVDGKFMINTERMVMAFQGSRGLPVDGKVDKATMAALVATPPEKAIPGREHMDDGVAAAKLGSTSVLTKIKLGAQAVFHGAWVGTLLDKAAQGFGLDAVGSVIGAGEKGMGLINRAASVTGAQIPAWAVGVVVVMSVAAIVVRLARGGTASNAEDAKTTSLGKPT